MMKHFTKLTNEMADLFAKNEPVIKAAIASLSNEKFNLHSAEGVKSYEGGVLVNGKPIVIYPSYVRDEKAKLSGTFNSEESAVVAAIETVVELAGQENGIETLREKYGECKSGDPLRDFIGEERFPNMFGYTWN